LKILAGRGEVIPLVVVAQEKNFFTRLMNKKAAEKQKRR